MQESRGAIDWRRQLHERCELQVCPAQITEDALHRKKLDPFIDELDLPQVHMGSSRTP
jgi:hypothetical protein